MDQRLNFGTEVRELKLGSTFGSGNNARTSFHTLKYDFKPASVDLSKVATLDVGSSNQVTVTVPHLDSSGVPKTVFKGNQKKYTKECVLIIDKITGEVTLERLCQNIQVKKTRSESNKAAPLPAGAGNGVVRQPLENSTQRTVSRTKVSTGYKKNSIVGLGGIIQRHSPLQGSPSYPHHKSPQQAPAWNANNNQSTLPSIPLIGMDDDVPASHNSSGGGASSMADQHSYNHQPPAQQHHQPQQHFQSHSSSLSLGNHQQKQPAQQQQQPQDHYPSQHNMMPSSNAHQSSHIYQNNHIPQSAVVNSMAAHDIGVLSSSESSSDSDSSGSGSDSDDEPNGRPNHHNNGHTNHSANPPMNNHNNNLLNGGLPTLLLDEDLRLSDSD